MNRHARFGLGLFWSAVVAAAGGSDSDPAALARALTAERDYQGAAIEYRRLALDEADGARRAGWYWAAAWSHWLAREPHRAERLLDASERDPGVPVEAHLLLRARVAEARGDRKEAEYYWESVADSDDDAARRHAARRLAALRLARQDAEGARAALETSPGNEKDALEGIVRWTQTPRRNPVLGGVLGIIPGLGYAYSGEYANALRSALLNGLFIWIMVRSAREESWGAFAAAAFFEFTWYSGSIYGGIDAAHRYNRNLDREARDRLLDPIEVQPDESAYPVIRLNFRP